MAINIHAPEMYQESMRNLFPRGPYWDKQFTDTESDASLFCKAKADLIARIRKRMEALQNESVIRTAEETLDDWERVLLGKTNWGLDTAQRRALLVAATAGSFNIESIKELGLMYGITITNIVFPFRPGLFGHSHFGINRIASPAAFSVLFIYASQPPDEETREEFEKQLLSIILANYIVHFIYGGA